MGLRSDNGEGVPDNVVQAYVWFSVSAAQEDKIGRTNRDMVSKLLITGQLEEGQKISTWCLESGY